MTGFSAYAADHSRPSTRSGPFSKLLLGVGHARLSRIARLSCLALIFGGLVCLFFNEVLFQGRTFGAGANFAWVMGTDAPAWGFAGEHRKNGYQVDPGASEWQIVPWARLVARVYSEGRFPLWNSHEGFGTPLAATGIAGVFDLLRLPPFVSAAPVAWDVYYVARAILGLVLAYVFARSIGLGAAAGLYLAIAYVFSGFMFIRGNNHYVEVYFLLPAILWGTELLVRGQLRLGLLITSVAIVMTQLAGMAESAILVLMYAAAYGLYRLAALARSSGCFTSVLRPSLWLAGAWLGGNCLAAPLLIPFAEYVHTQTASVHNAATQLGLGHLAARDIARMGVPYDRGLPTAGPDGLDNYSGAAVIALACLGSTLLARRARVPGHGMFALSACLLIAAKLYGVPLINDLGSLPLLNLTIIYLWCGPLLVFSLALLGAHAVHALSQEHFLVRRSDIAGALLLFGAYFGVAAWLNRDVLPGIDVVIELAFWGTALLAGVEAIVLPLVVRRRRVSLGGFVACLVVTVELLILAPHGSLQDRYDPFTEPPFVRYLLNASSTSSPFRTFGTQGVLYPNSSSAFGLDDIRAIDALYPGRFFKFVDAFLQPIGDRFTGRQDFFGQPEVSTEGNKWLDLTGVRYIVSPVGLYPGNSTFIDGIMAESVLPPIAKSTYVLNGESRTAWFEQPPRRAHRRFVVDTQHQAVRFSIAVDSEMAPQADVTGVQFSIQVDDGSQKLEIYRHVVDSRDDNAVGRWIDGEADLSAFTGETIELIFNTVPLQIGPVDPAGWGDVRLEPAAQDSLVRVFRGGADVYENSSAFPRAFVVGQAVGVVDEDAAVEAMRSPGFDPSQLAVVDGPDASHVAKTLTSDQPHGSVVFESYADQLVRLSVSTAAPGLLILTDVYFPGWQARLDGQPVSTYPTDLAFRGVLVPAGSHEVDFTYAPASFLTGLVVAGCALFLLGFALVTATLRRRSLPRSDSL